MTGRGDLPGQMTLFSSVLLPGNPRKWPYLCFADRYRWLASAVSVTNMWEDGDMQNRCVEHNAVVFPKTFTIFLLLCISRIFLQKMLRCHSQFVHAYVDNCFKLICNSLRLCFSILGRRFQLWGNFSHISFYFPCAVHSLFCQEGFTVWLALPGKGRGCKPMCTIRYFLNPGMG